MASEERGQKQRLSEWEAAWREESAAETTSESAVTGRNAPIEPLRSIEGMNGGGARTRGELVLLPRIDELAEPRRGSTSSDPARDETDRIVAESGRYRLAVIRRARKRLEGTAGSVK